MIRLNAFVATSLTAVSLFLGTATPAVAQGSTPPANIASEVYLASFFKAAPGQAAALLKTLQQQDPKDPMAGHVLLLRHAQGSDWDYALIQYMGPTATVRVPPQPVAGAKPPQPTQAWHTDTFVAGAILGGVLKADGSLCH